MKPRSVPIDVPKGTTQRIDFIFDDQPDLTEADIVFTVKLSPSSEEYVFQKRPDLALSTDLSEGKFTIEIEPDDTSGITSRSYIYEVRVTIGDEAYVPFLGAFNVFGTLT